MDLEMAKFWSQLSVLPYQHLLSTEVTENDIPLLLSKDAMKKTKTFIDFSKDKIIIFDE